MSAELNYRGIFRLIALTFTITVSTGCAQLVTKREAFPGMYGAAKPLTVVVLPAINESTAADAGDYLNVTITQPIADSGYYVIPNSIAADIFRQEGIVDGIQLASLPASSYKTAFGADAVLYLTIKKWDKNYYVIAGNVTVELEYVLISTSSEEVLWSYAGEVVVDTSGKSSSGFPLADLIANTIATAVSTAATRYVTVAGRVHQVVMPTLPFGKYHPKSGVDADSATVNPKFVKAALEAN